jgi:hypothetical protein
MSRRRQWTRPGVLHAALVLVTLTFGCGGRGSRDEVRRQLMQHQQVKRHQRLFYVGIGEGGALEEATQAAYDEITRQLTWLPPGSRDLLRGLYRVDRTATDRDGRVHLLAVLEREAAAAHLQRVAVEKRAALKGTLNDCRRKLEAGELGGARKCVGGADQQVQLVRQLLAASKAAVGDPARPQPFPEEKEAAELTAKVSESAARGRTVLLHVLRVVDGQLTGDLDAEFRTVVSGSGFRLADGSVNTSQVNGALEGNTKALADAGRAAGAGYVVVGRVAARFSSEEMGQYFAWARGQVRVVETTSGRTVADLSYDKIKGGHVSRQQACERAIEHAVSRLQAELNRKLAALR